MDEDNKEHNEEAGVDITRGKRRKKSKTGCKANKCIISLILIFGAAVHGYFILNFQQNYSLLNQIDSIIKEVNSTSSAESFFYFCYNAQQQLTISKTQKILNMEPESVVRDNINKMFELDSQIHEEHSINVAIHTAKYKETYNNLMMLKPCEIISNLNTKITKKTCEEFAAGTLKEGLALGLARHYENMRFILSKYLQLMQGTDVALSDTYCKNSYVTSTNSLVKVLCLNPHPTSKELDTMQNVYIKYLFRYLVKELQNEMNMKYLAHTNLRLGLMVGLLIFLFLVYLFLWLPLIGRLSTDFIRTRSMLTMIPKSIIRKINSIRNYVKKCMNDYNMTSY